MVKRLNLIKSISLSLWSWRDFNLDHRVASTVSFQDWPTYKAPSFISRSVHVVFLGKIVRGSNVNFTKWSEGLSHNMFRRFLHCIAGGRNGQMQSLPLPWRGLLCLCKAFPCDFVTLYCESALNYLL